uniref:Endonuclease/exonuclease/phosphatase domain-containing protein n=1 Tax=Picea glauca TaxID=3330 RepID=A0A117NI21_PICGL|nr:hypothetical protein ABT39_MTgene3802 [Picea glauca]QHR87513.1 hypothetical protein Q903MT_gene1524 [Picea sitchensis]
MIGGLFFGECSVEQQVQYSGQPSLPLMKLSLLSWNVRGMTIPSRKQFVHGVLQRTKPDVVFLQ